MFASTPRARYTSAPPERQCDPPARCTEFGADCRERAGRGGDHRDERVRVDGELDRSLETPFS